MDSTSIFQYLNFNFFNTTQVMLLVLLGIISWILLRSVTPPRGKNGKPIPGPIGIPIWGYLPFLGKEPHKTLNQMSGKYGDVIGTLNLILHVVSTRYLVHQALVSFVNGEVPCRENHQWGQIILNLLVVYSGVLVEANMFRILTCGERTKYTIVLNTYTAMKDVLGHPGAQDRAANIFDFISKSGFHVHNGQKWIEQRRFCRTATRDIGLGRGYWEDLIMEETTNLTNKLRATKGEAIDISHDLCASVLSNIFSLLIGRRLKEVEEADKIQLSIDYTYVSLHYISLSMAATLIPGLRKLFEIFKIAGFDWAAKTVKDFNSFISEEINRHKTSTATKANNDFINVYLEKLAEMEKSKSVKHFFSEPMLHGNVVVLFLGSTDTIFKSICWLLRLMAAHKDVQEKVYAELMESVGKEGRARYEEREKFPYTFATVMEGQRISSIVPLSTSRSTSQDIRVKGMVIPKGSQVTVNLWALHNDLDYWDQPELFKPERFLKDDGKKLISHIESYAPFSFGRRNCPGTSIAYMKILFYFSEIVKRFEIGLPPGVEAEFKVKNGLVTGLEPQPMCFKERRNDA